MKKVQATKKLIKYVPVPCEEEGSIFKGFVEMRKPSQEEFFAHQGTIERKEEDSGHSYHKRLADFSKKFIKVVQIDHEDGTEYRSIDDLLEDVDTLDLIVDIACACYAGPTKKKLVTKLMAQPGSQPSSISSSESSSSSKEGQVAQTSEPKV